MTQEMLDKILEKHSKWLGNEDDGVQADLQVANLRWTDLQGADLQDANFQGADLQGADLEGARLQGANLQEADLRGADLRWADLEGADLRWANLQGANFQKANLRGAHLECANLTGAKTFGTILSLQCPEEGPFIAWKQLRFNAIAKLWIPEDAKRSSATSRKCRANKAIVLSIYSEDGESIAEGRSQQDGNFIYRVGETVYSDKWDEDRWNECSNGIHFFITRKEAEEY